MAAVLLWAVTSVAAHRLWYDHPAQTWTQALPIGNGVMGAMVFGTPAVERIQLNEETIWAGMPNNVCNPEAKDYLPRVRQLIFEGRYAEAQALANEKVMPVGAGQNMGMPYQPFGDLYIAMPGHANYTGYERLLDLDNARAITRYIPPRSPHPMPMCSSAARALRPPSRASARNMRACRTASDSKGE